MRENVSQCFESISCILFSFSRKKYYFCNILLVSGVFVRPKRCVHLPAGCLTNTDFERMESLKTAKGRRSLILQRLKNNSSVSVKELHEEFGVSEVTIRKDLNMLYDRNLLIRTRGGAMCCAAEESGDDASISSKRFFNMREKQAIGRLAATLIEEGNTIMLDSGTTTLEIARNLQRFQRLTIITNAVNIAVELLKYKRFNVILLGGNLREPSHSTVGPVAESNLRLFYCDKLFLGVDSFNIECGLSTPNIEEANINQADRKSVV